MVVMEGSGEELLVRADEWRHLPHVRLIKMDGKDGELVTRLNQEAAEGEADPAETHSDEWLNDE
jgi:hypothetical protein